METDDNAKIRELIGRALPANDNANRPITASKAVPHEKLQNTGINIVGNHNIVIEANLLFLTTCVALLVMINILLNL